MRRRPVHFALWLLPLLLHPAAGLEAGEALRFCIVADSRGYPGFATIAQQVTKVPGGAGRFIISAGDTDPCAVTCDQLQAAFGQSFPWYPVVGNHEVPVKGTDASADDMRYLREYYLKHLKGKVNPGPAGAEETSYSFDAGDVHIAVLNLYWDGKTAPDSDRKGDGEVVAPLRDWLANDLRNSRQPWKLVVGHEPAFPQPDRDWGGARHPADALTQHPVNRTAFWAVLEEFHVAAYVCGHTHRYSRYQPPGSKVWQIDAAQARSDKDWKYDAFVIVTADAQSLKFDAYRNLKEQAKFEVTDSLTLKPSNLPGAPSGGPPAADRNDK